jgi:Carboxypeptidase regulatory-like domain
MQNYARTLRRVWPLLAALSLACVVYAQGFGTIVGTITDPSGGVVPAAKIRITDEATATYRDTVTNSQGYFVRERRGICDCYS